MQLARIQIQVEMMMSELKATETKYNGLKYAIHSDLCECTTTVFLQCKHPECMQGANIEFVEWKMPEFDSM